MYSEIYLRLEPLGLERVASAVRAAGHEVRLLDLQIFKASDYFAELGDFKPAAVGFSLNYLANVPEVIDLAKDVKQLMKWIVLSEPYELSSRMTKRNEADDPALGARPVAPQARALHLLADRARPRPARPIDRANRGTARRRGWR
jgi:hypothetical protein